MLSDDDNQTIGETASRAPIAITTGVVALVKLLAAKGLVSPEEIEKALNNANTSGFDERTEKYYEVLKAAIMREL